MVFEWRRVGSWLDISCIFSCTWGTMAPPEEPGRFDMGLPELTDVALEVITRPGRGLGLPNAALLWHYSMVLVYGLAFAVIAALTTPVDVKAGQLPYGDLFKKLVLFHWLWEALGLGVDHGPLAGKLAPPFLDWWYRATPGVLKYPFFSWLPARRTWLDVAVLNVGFYVAVMRAMLSASIGPSEVLPVVMCGAYEFFFDHGMHICSYATQHLHMVVCMCFPQEQGQIAGLQLALLALYFGSGLAKWGAWGPHMNAANLLFTKFMYRHAVVHKAMLNAPLGSPPDYSLSGFSVVLGYIASFVELAGPLLVLCNYMLPVSVYVGIGLVVAMHLYIMASFIADVYVWNLTDAAFFVLLFKMMHFGFDWSGLCNMHWALAAYMLLSTAYIISGHIMPDGVPYICAHRHAAGNWAMGYIVVAQGAEHKLQKVYCHGAPPTGPNGWMPLWNSILSLGAWLWLANLPSRMALALVSSKVGSAELQRVSIFHSFALMNQCCGSLRADGVSTLRLITELGEICGFEEGECELFWAGAFPFHPSPGANPRASWKIVDSKVGEVKAGTYDVKSVLAAGRPSVSARLLRPAL